ncbi:high-affinity nickel transporter [Histoplasma capsulatum]|uniref:Nickel/cobalt efflux system n=1 Tax=Ajellomyces capsulatus TaxID=5037 RepID=A0A8A1MDJ2_AJECA|nr:high-affinity nickel transporter [Histoplasma capsulatum]
MKKMLRLKEGQEPWKMYPLGVLFGLGFDTSSEVALLGISSIEATRGTSIWVILIFPFLFTAGMCLLDTIDGALMLSLYVQPAENFLPSKSVNSSSATLSTPSSGAGQPLTTSDAATANPSRNPRNPIAFLYYSIVLTSLTVIVATVIGTIQLLTLILNVTEATGRFWNGVEVAGEYYDVIGGSICGCFILVGGLSVLVYPSWRRWVAQRHELQDQNVDGALEEEGGHEVEVEAGDGIATTSPTSIVPGAGMGSLKGDRGEDGKGQVGRVLYSFVDLKCPFGSRLGIHPAADIIVAKKIRILVLVLVLSLHHPTWPCCSSRELSGFWDDIYPSARIAYCARDVAISLLSLPVRLPLMRRDTYY